LLFDYPSPTSMAGHLLGHLVQDDAATGREAAFAGLDRLANLLPQLSEDQDTRAQLTQRLQTLLSLLGGTTGAPDTTTESILNRIDSATDDEMFAFIENDLGLS
jgi:hypothetical protein